MKHKDFIGEVAKQTNLDIQVVSKFTDSTCRIISDILCDGDSLSIQNFGVFEVKKRNERISVNPATGKKWLIPPKLVPDFKPGSTLKEKIKGMSSNE